MFKKKKPAKEPAKELGKDVLKQKKVALITAPCFNLPDEPRTGELKSLVKSIELRRPPGNPYKKSASRKSTCKSVKQGGPQRPPEFRTLIQAFK